MQRETQNIYKIIKYLSLFNILNNKTDRIFSQIIQKK